MKRRLNQVFRHPELPIILAPFLLLAPVWLTGKALFWGTPSTQFVPWWVTAARQLLAGQLPLWNPGLGMGAPLLANYQSALLYPPTWIYFLLYKIGGTPALAWGMAPLVAAHLAWAGLGTARLVRSLGLGALAQAVSGLAYGLSGYLVARSAFLSINAAASWLPWILYGLVLLLKVKPSEPGSRLSPRLAGVTLLAVLLAAQLLAGHAQTAWYTLILVGLWAAFWAFADSKVDQAGTKNGRQPRLAANLRRLGANWGWLCLAVLLAALLAAAQLLPTAEYLLESQRAGAVEYEFAMTYSFWPWRFLTLLAPALFGSPATGDYWGYANYWEDAVYLGLLPFLLALLALFTRGQRVRSVDERLPKLIAFLFAITLVAFLLALGKNTPLFPWLYRHFPTFDMFQAPTRLSLLAVICLALLAGIGAESWRRPAGRSLYWVRLGTAAALAVTLAAGLAATLARQYMSQVEPSTIRAVALAGLWGVGIGILTLTAPREIQSPAHRSLTGPWAWAVVLWVGADLLVAGWGLNPGITLDFYRFPSPSAALVREAAGQGRLYLPKDEEASLKFDRFFRFASYDLLGPPGDWIALRAALLPNLNLLDRIDSANNFDPLVPGRYSAWIQALETASPDTQQRMLDLMGVNVVEWEQASQPFGVVFESREGYPLVRWSACGISTGDASQALELAIAGQTVNRGVTVLEVRDEAADLECNGGAQAEVQILRQQPAHQKILVNAPQPGYLVIAETWYPGWQALLDGSAVDLIRADYLFKAVHVPAGDHLVELRYRPPAFLLGILLSGLAWSFLGLITARNYLFKTG